MPSEFNFINIIVAAGVLFFVFLLPRLLVTGKKTRKKQKNRYNTQTDPRVAERAGRPRAKSHTVYDSPYEWFAGSGEESTRTKSGSQGVKKRRRSKPAPQREGGPPARVSLTEMPEPAPPPKKLPVYSDNPVVNGVIWAEILTRRGTRRRGMH